MAGQTLVRRAVTRFRFASTFRSSFRTRASLRRAVADFCVGAVAFGFDVADFFSVAAVDVVVVPAVAVDCVVGVAATGCEPDWLPPPPQPATSSAADASAAAVPGPLTAPTVATESR